MSLYDTLAKFEKATATISAALILKDGNPQARIVIHHRPTTLEVFLSGYGIGMVCGKAHKDSWGDATEHALKAAVKSGEEDLNLPLGPLDGSGVWEGHLKAAGYRVVWVC